METRNTRPYSKPICVLCAPLHLIALMGGVVLTSGISTLLPIAFVLALGDMLARSVILWLDLGAEWLHRLPSTGASLITIMSWVGALLLAQVVLVSLRQMLWPRRRQMKRLACADLDRLEDQPAKRHVEALCRQYRIRSPKMWEAQTDGIRAFVLSPPFRRPQLVVSRGVLALPTPIAHWILSHEVAHLVHRDAEQAHSWHRYLDGVSNLNRLRVKAFRLTTWLLLNLVPGLGLLLARLLVLLDRLFALALSLGVKVGGAWFEVWSRWGSRRMEFRADAFASLHSGTEPGIALFEGLAQASFEPMPLVTVWRTHPTHAERARALRSLASQD